MLLQPASRQVRSSALAVTQLHVLSAAAAAALDWLCLSEPFICQI